MHYSVCLDFLQACPGVVGGEAGMLLECARKMIIAIYMGIDYYNLLQQYTTTVYACAQSMGRLAPFSALTIIPLANMYHT